MTIAKDEWTRKQLTEYEEEAKEIERCAKEMRKLAKKLSRSSTPETIEVLDTIHHEIRAALDRAAWIAEEEL